MKYGNKKICDCLVIFQTYLDNVLIAKYYLARTTFSVIAIVIKHLDYVGYYFLGINIGYEYLIDHQTLVDIRSSNNSEFHFQQQQNISKYQYEFNDDYIIFDYLCIDRFGWS